MGVKHRVGRLSDLQGKLRMALDSVREEGTGMARRASDLLDAVSAAAPQGTEHKWRAIQDAMPDFPPGALREFIREFIGAVFAGGGITEFMDDWYRRALSAQASRRHPDAEPLDSVDDWHKLPDRFFEPR
jgi:hypothetical protein